MLDLFAHIWKHLAINFHHSECALAAAVKDYIYSHAGCLALCWNKMYDTY